MLAGGQSLRMGRDKALLSNGSRSLIEEVVEAVSAVAASVAVVGAPERYRAFGFDCLPDLRPGSSPLCGIEAALAAARGEYNVIVGCDMPGLRTAWLRSLLMVSKDTGALCVAACDTAGRTHPLCAVYRTGCLPVVRSMLDEGRLKLLSLLEELNATTFEIGGKLWNINTPEDWDEWARSLMPAARFQHSVL